jgi:hypothetical protein
MKAALPLAVTLCLAASAAWAQTLVQTPAPAAASTPAPRAAKPAAGDTVSGVTVSPFPKKACSSRDKDCIAMVVAELKRLYPEELKKFCFAEQTSAVRTQIVNEQLRESLGGNNPSIPISSQVSPVIKTACASDPK